MTKFTGIRLNFDKSGEANVIPAQKILPGRLDHIEKLIVMAETNDPSMPDNAEDQLDFMIYNPRVPGFKSGISHREYEREGKLYDRYLKLKNKTFNVVVNFYDPLNSNSIPNTAA